MITTSVEKNLAVSNAAKTMITKYNNPAIAPLHMYLENLHICPQQIYIAALFVVG